MLKLFRYGETISFLAVVAIGLLAARPLLVPRLPHGTDTLTHFYTLIQLDHLMQQGVFYSRWLPYRASGLGTPLFHYYAPLAYYVTQGLGLFGLEPLAALRLAFSLTLVGGALGMYMWVREILEYRGAALVATAAYICGPYVLFNTYSRGGFAEQFAIMLMPLTLWAFRRLVVTGQAQYVVISTLTYAALILAHNASALIFSPILLAYAIILAREGAAFKSYAQALTQLVATIGLGLGLSAFFWLPALAERNAIWADLLYTLPGLDYRHHFMALNDLLITPLTPTIRPGLSFVAVGLGLMGLFNIGSQSRLIEKDLSTRPATESKTPETPEFWFAQRLHEHSFLAALIAIICTVMVLPVAAGIWEAIPLLRFLQFPQRFLGVASLFVAFLAGLGACSLRQRFKDGQAIGLVFVAIGLLVSHTWGLTQVRYYPSLPTIDVNFTMQKEREQGFVNTTYMGNFIPATVKTPPPVEQLAQASAERLDSTSLPAEASLIAARYDPLRYEVSVTSPMPFMLRFNTFYFPGWQAQLDDQATPITPTDPYGLISVPVPAGQHLLVVWFGSTPLRTLANGLTASSAVILGLALIMMWLRFLKRRITDDRTKLSDQNPSTCLDRSPGRLDDRPGSGANLPAAPIARAGGSRRRDD